MTQINQLNVLSSPDAAGEEISLLDLLLVLVTNLRLLVIGPVVVGLIALAYSYTLAPIFTSTVKFLAPQQQQSSAASLLQNLGSLGGLAGVSAGIKNPSDQYIALLQSHAVQDAMVERFKLTERDGFKRSVDSRKSLAGRTRVTLGKDNLIYLEVDDRDPAFAAQQANAYVDEFRKYLGRLALTEAQQRRAFLENQFTKTRDNLVKAEQALKASGVNSSALKSNPATAMGALAQLQAQIAAQEVKLTSMRGYLADTAPMLRQAQIELAALRGQLTKIEGASTPTKEGDADYVVRYREFKYQETLFELFAKQYELAKVDESREGPIVQVIDSAEPADLRSSPKRGKFAITAALTAGLLLVVFVLARYAFRVASADTKKAPKLQAIHNAFLRWH